MVDIEIIKTTLLAREKEAYARVRREHGDVEIGLYGLCFTPEELGDMWVLNLIYNLERNYVISIENPAEFDKEKVAETFKEMITNVRDITKEFNI